MNVTELKNFLNENIDRSIAGSFFNDDFPGSDARLEYYEEEVVEFYRELEKNGIKAEQEASHGGEGQGDEYWTVYSFTSGDAKVYVKFDGWYQSYNGSEFEQWFFVEPKQVEVTQYFPVK